jgi:hypothetical protein
MNQMEKDGSWKPMWKKDSLALEDAVAKGLKTLLVEGGRYMVLPHTPLHFIQRGTQQGQIEDVCLWCVV